MNVNPFSYLIEKLKGKVDKSGDTMSGNLTVDRRNGTAGTEGYSGIILGNNVPYTQNENSTGYARFFTKNGYSIDVYAKHEPNNNQEIILPESDGTLALKSDIPNITVLEIDTTGKSLNTAYYESLPTGYTRDNCIMLTACFIKYGTQYTIFSLIDDPDLAMLIGINGSSQIAYTLNGSQTLNGILKIALIKYS